MIKTAFALSFALSTCMVLPALGAEQFQCPLPSNPNDPANRLYPRQITLNEVLDLLNDGDIKADETELREAWPKIWSQDETIGWVYQYFTPKEMREKARSESRAPRNSNELSFRNQFFTPRYVVEFLTDNTLGHLAGIGTLESLDIGFAQFTDSKG